MNYRDINLISFFNCGIICFVIIMTRDFNIRDNDWDLSYPHYFIHADIFRKVADLFNLKLLIPITQVLIRYMDNSNDSNFMMIDLMFLWANVK